MIGIDSWGRSLASKQLGEDLSTGLLLRPPAFAARCRAVIPINRGEAVLTIHVADCSAMSSKYPLERR